MTPDVVTYLTFAGIGCLLLAWVLCLVPRRRGCPWCRGCDKVNGQGYCAKCGDSWNLP